MAAVDVDRERLDAFRAAAWRVPAHDVPSSHAARLGAFLDAHDAGTGPRAAAGRPATPLEFAAALYEAAFTGLPVRAGEIVPGDPFHAAVHGGHPDRAPGERA